MEEKDGKFSFGGRAKSLFLQKTTRFRLASEGLRRGRQRSKGSLSIAGTK